MTGRSAERVRGAGPGGGTAAPQRVVGLTLVEILFALLVLQLGIMAALSMAVLAARTLNRAQALERVVATAGDVYDSLARTPVVTSGADTVEGLAVSWAPFGEGFRVRVEGQDVPPLELEGRGDRWSRVP